jgi:thiol-disulfide isomerase/thioredoxin
MIKYLLSFIFILSLTIKMAEAQGYQIKVGIKNLGNKEIILGHHFTDKLFSVDTLKLDSNGFGIFQGITKLPEGIYFIMTPSHAMFDFFVTDNQYYSIETDTLNLLEKMKFENSPENDSAWEYMKFITSKQKETADLREKKEKMTNENDIKSIDYLINQIGLEFKESTQSVIERNKDNFVGIFIKATQDIEVPEPPKDAEGKIIDPNFQYRYYRSHYFDNFDIADARLLRTPIYEEKIKFYLDKIVPQNADTVNFECDKLLNKSEKDKEVFRYLLITLFNKYASSVVMGFDAVYVHIAEKWYIPKATFSDTTFINQTSETIKILKPLLLGKPAPALKMVWVPTERFIQAISDTVLLNNTNDESNIDLFNIQANYTILVFWTSDCGRCKKAMPELYGIFKRLKNNGLAVMSVNELRGVEGKKKWIDFINKYEMYEWYNVYSPTDYSYKKTFNVIASPTFFILDKDKNIIAKGLEPKQIEEFLNDLIKQKQP